MSEELNYSFDYNDIEDLLDECLLTLKSKLNININQAEIIDIQFMTMNQYHAVTIPAERKEYLLLFNREKINSKAQLINAIYHELGHIYQLDRLYNEKILAYDSFAHDLVAENKEDVELLKQHLNINDGHTKYWLEYAEKVNTIIKPDLLITAYVDQQTQLIKEELYEPDYFKLDFDGFYD